MSEPLPASDPSQRLGVTLAPKLILLLVSALAAGSAWQFFKDRSAAAPATTVCEPEGGLVCVENAVQVCENGTTVDRGVCSGGCQDKDGIVRCRNAAGNLVAPVGGICRPGMSLCGMDDKSLLVCKEGLLVVGALCPGGCSDEGEDQGLFCRGEDGSLRFAEGAACPQFADRTPYACGPNGNSLLGCKGGVLTTREVQCHTCFQRARGDLKCFDQEGISVEL